jgi:hypothetical protein
MARNNTVIVDADPFAGLSRFEPAHRSVPPSLATTERRAPAQPAASRRDNETFAFEPSDDPLMPLASEHQPKRRRTRAARRPAAAATAAAPEVFVPVDADDVLIPPSDGGALALDLSGGHAAPRPPAPENPSFFAMFTQSYERAAPPAPAPPRRASRAAPHLVPPPAGEREPVTFLPEWAPELEQLVARFGPPPDNADNCWLCTFAKSGPPDAVEDIALVQKQHDAGILTCSYEVLADQLHRTWVRRCRRRHIQALLKRRVEAQLREQGRRMPLDWDIVVCTNNDSDVALREDHPLASLDWVRQLFDGVYAECPDWSPGAMFWHFQLHEYVYERYLMFAQKMHASMHVRTLCRGAWSRNSDTGEVAPDIEVNKQLTQMAGVVKSLNDRRSTELIERYRQTLADAHDTRSMLNMPHRPVVTRRAVASQRRR